MDKPTTPTGPNASAWPEDSGSEPGFGATGVFQSFKPDDASETPEAGWQGARPADAMNQPNQVAAKPLAEPTVHKVVLGEGSPDRAPELLERIRMASQEKPATTERAPAAAPSAPAAGPIAPAAKPRGGFTELLRTLEVEMPTLTAPVQMPAPARVTQPAASQSSGFTSLLRTLSAPDGAPATADSVKFTEPAGGYVADESLETPPIPARASGPSSGGFTELFRAAPVEETPKSVSAFLGGASETASAATESKPGSFTQMFSKVGAAETPTPVAPVRDAAPPPAENKPGSFTQLFGSMGGTEAPAPAAPVRDMAPPAPESKPGSFTQMFGKIGGTDAPASPGAVKASAAGPPAANKPESLTQMFSVLGGAEAPAPVTRAPEAARPAVDNSKPGSFTQLFGVLGGADAPSPITPLRDSAAPPRESKPGSFTQMFGSLGAAEAPAPIPAGSDMDRRDSSGASAGSFTRMLSLEPQAAPAELPPLLEQKPVSDRLNFGLTPESGKPAAASGDPFAAQPFAEPQPAPTPPQAGGVGITQLIRMLDDPSSKAPIQRRDEAPLTSPQGAGAGAWTQTYASLGEEPAAAKSKAPDWAPPQTLAPSLGFKAAPEVYAQSNLREPAMNAPVPPSGASGPSEFTRILDASRIREQAMKGDQAAAAESAAGAPPPPQRMAPPLPPPPPPPMPNYSVPVAPPAVGMHGGGGVPRPAVYPPSVPHAPAMYAPTPHVPQAPGMYVPPPPMPAVPQAPPPPKAAAPQPPANKMQQLIPILLVVVIVLLVVLIVTVIFLMKH